MSTVFLKQTVRSVFPGFFSLSLSWFFSLSLSWLFNDLFEKFVFFLAFGYFLDFGTFAFA